MIDVKNLSVVDDETIPYTNMGGGVKRKIMTYSDQLMVTKVSFERGSIGAIHNHPHLQISYVAKGKFEVTMGGEKKILKEGDLFFAPTLVFHGVVCLEAGILVDVFNPKRDDFLTP
jgi:quercetin dioxygenase-like cupin family protein